ncbi:MAG: hypothetical protein ETSY1_35570 [Candidatus Entotheonella factor]|uniref:Laminin G domain-containing protein n=1 Tax=Entotheonella factor TaxID=1429438 RepID=W4L895_ENTF1|nr:MAG: hypothetical protein ETSY1_35570 [Candidatus Entotheonella factor]
MSEVICYTVTDNTLKSVNGTLSNAVVETTDPTFGSVVHINGANNSFVDFGTAIGQFRTQDFTVAFWFQTTEQHRYFDLAGNRTVGSHGNFLAIRMTGNHESSPRGRVSVEVDQDGNGTNFIGVSSQVTGLNDGDWHHIAVVRRGNSLELYVDGVSSNRGSANGVANIANGNAFKLGRSLVGHDAKFAPNARFRALCVYDVALTDRQVPGLVNLRNTHSSP